MHYQQGVWTRSPEEVARRLRELETESMLGSKPNPQKRFMYVAMGASDAIGIGSSTLDGGYVPRVTARLRQRLGTVQLLNLGINGATLPEIARMELPRAIEAKPDLVTLMAGGNDVIQSVPPEEFRDALRRILRGITQTTRRVVVATVPNIALLPIVNAIPDFFLPFGDKRAYLSNASTALGRIVIEEVSRHGARLVHVTMSDTLNEPSLISPDGFHPSDEGYRRLADRFWEQIEPLLPV